MVSQLDPCERHRELTVQPSTIRRGAIQGVEGKGGALMIKSNQSSRVNCRPRTRKVQRISSVCTNSAKYDTDRWIAR